MKKRVVTNPAKPENRPVLTAKKSELIERIRLFSDPIQSFNMTADLSASIGAIQGGEVTDYASIRGYILYQRPSDIRIIGLDPVIRTKAFDMVSDGEAFQLLIPSKNRLIKGRNEIGELSQNKLENLRPSAFLVSLMILAPEAETDFSMLEDDTDEMHAQYELLIASKSESPYIKRSIYFDRTTLNIARQRTFDTGGGIVSDTRYSDWKAFGTQMYPGRIDINRPKEGYEVVINVLTMKINEALRADQFALAAPSGVQVRELK